MVLLGQQVLEAIQVPPASQALLALLALQVLKAKEDQRVGQDLWAFLASTELQVLLDHKARWAIPAHLAIEVILALLALLVHL